MNIIWTILSLLLILAVSLVPIWLFLRIVQGVLSKRVANWHISPMKAIVRIVAIIFFPFIVIITFVIAFSFTGLDGKITWLGESHSASIRDEASWHTFIFFAMTWPFFLFYVFGGITLAIRLYRIYKNALGSITK